MKRDFRKPSMQSSITRRGFVMGAGACALICAKRQTARAEASGFPPMRTVTHGPKHHWFGYYDKLQFDPSGRRLLGMQVDFEHRSPTPEDHVVIGMVDLEDDDRWIKLGTSHAWSWQQGCMLQWRPGSDRQVLWNDRQADRYVCRLLDVDSGQMETIDHPIYAVSPDGETAVAADFCRIQDVRPGYGYPGLPDPFANELQPKRSGIFRVDLRRGTQELILSLAEIASFGRPHPTYPGAKHYVNHLLFNTDGSRFEFLHRWRLPDGSRRTRMLTAKPDGSELRVLDDNGLTSHFIWRDMRHLLAFSEQPSHGRRFYLFEDAEDGKVEAVGPEAMTSDGHCSYLPDKRWIINDTYPDRSTRHQTVYLYELATGRVVTVGRFHSPIEYTGEWRCDTHPRHSPDGRWLVIDSPHNGQGRQMHLIDIGEIVNG
jgi:hypothetical protein